MKATLPTNYQDDILNVLTEGKRRYRLVYNDDNTVSLIDVTPYDQEGSDYGAGDINATNQAVNESFDKNKLIRDMDAINALTEEGYAPDALALKDVSDSLYNSLGNISNIGNDTYNSVEKLLQYYIDNGYLPDINSIALVPPMTSATTPSGVVSSSTESTTYRAWKAFDGISGTSADVFMAESTTGWIQYQFTSPVIVKKVEITNRNDGNTLAIKDFTVQGSDNGTSWTDLGSFVKSNGENNKEAFELANDTSYLIYRISIQSCHSSKIAIGEIQFYGTYA